MSGSNITNTNPNSNGIPTFWPYHDSCIYL